MSLRRGRILLTALLLVVGCDRSASSRPDRAPPATKSRPPSALRHRTTSGAIAVKNLDAQIASSEALLRRTPTPPPTGAMEPEAVEARAKLVALLLTRGQTLGILDDYDRAEQIAEETLVPGSASPRALEVRASVRAVFHEFPSALADLEAAERFGGGSLAVRTARASLDAAVGRTDEALAAYQAVAAESPTLNVLVMMATLRADRGELAEAEQLFSRALGTYRDVSPFPVAWLEFQQALMYERAGRPADARALYEAAHARLPAYAQVASHLAGLEAEGGNRRRAIQLLEAALVRSDDPEYVGQLAALHRDDDRAAEAERLKAQAAARYEELVRQHPLAFADHAARFWLGVGGNPTLAMALAETNLGARKTDEAYRLVLSATLGRLDARACEVADEAVRRARPSTELLILARNAYRACGRSADVTRIEARLARAP